eukprot:4022527-Pyramimonas_sp.AAC.1
MHSAMRFLSGLDRPVSTGYWMKSAVVTNSPSSFWMRATSWHARTSLSSAMSRIGRPRSIAGSSRAP